MIKRFVVAALLLSAHAGAQTYTAVDLGTLGGGWTIVAGVNESGQATGRSLTAAGSAHAFLYSGGPLVDIVPSSSFSEGTGINSSGEVVGGYNQTGTLRGFRYSNGTLTTLPDFEGPSPFTVAYGINDLGWIVGESAAGDGVNHPFLLKPGLMLDLGNLGGHGGGAAFAINAAGQTVGYASVGGLTWHGFLYNGSFIQDLGALGNPVNVSFATAVNAQGTIVGYAYPGNGSHHAVVYRGSVVDLGTLGGGSSEAHGINAAGRVVGTADTPDGSRHAFVMDVTATATGPMVDLNALAPPGLNLIDAAAINSAGQIVAYSETRSYLLSPSLFNRLAYAWADQPTAASYTPSSAYAYNSSGGPITITRQTTGTYHVTFGSFPFFGTNLSYAYAISAYGSSTITCAAPGASLSNGVPNVTVTCVDTLTRRLADSRFDILVVGNRGLPFLSAFVQSGGPAPVPPPNPFGSWTTGRLAPSVLHNGPAGDYNVNLGTGNTPMSAKLVTAIGDQTRCNYAQGISGGLEVKCYDTTGAAVDSTFSVLQVSGGWPGRRAGFAIADLATSPSYTPSAVSSYNSSGGAITATRSSVGHYSMNFAGLQKLAGHTEHVQVAGMGTILRTCNVVSWGNSATGLQVNVECRDGAGNFVDTRYDVLVIE